MLPSPRRRYPPIKEMSRCSRSGRLALSLAIPVFIGQLFVFSGLAEAGAKGSVQGPVLTSLSVHGSVVTLRFRIPKRPAGRFLHLSVDRGRLLGRRIEPEGILEICVGHLRAGRHRLGFELAGKDQIVKTDEVPVRVVVPGGAPFSCPSTGKGS
jgi:hypothetical protein